MKKLLRILIVQSGKELFRYKSFFLLIFALILLDRFLKKVVHVDRSSLNPESLKEISFQSAQYVFEVMPGVLVGFLADYRTFLVIGGLFLLKQLISMWPSSDMRRMHRQERGTFGLFGSLLAIRWEQVLWDGMAVVIIVGVTGVWTTIHYVILHSVWQAHPSAICLLALLVLVFLFLPMTLAGFSYSSKLAVISRGGFTDKFKLFLRLFWDHRIRWASWLFFMARLMIEALFVIILPAVVIILMDIFWVRVLTASLLATPVYSYLKMASFKFFLEIYRPFPLVREEYRSYYSNYDLL